MNLNLLLSALAGIALGAGATTAYHNSTVINYNGVECNEANVEDKLKPSEEVNKADEIYQENTKPYKRIEFDPTGL